MVASLSDTSQLSFFEDFHISPIKVSTNFQTPVLSLSHSLTHSLTHTNWKLRGVQLHLSLSLGSSGDAADEAAALQSFNLLLKSIGATLTDVDDIIFK